MDTVVFDDSVAYYEYLKHENPILLQDYADALPDDVICEICSPADAPRLMALKRSYEPWLRNNPDLLPPNKGGRKKLDKAAEEYKSLPNLEKIKYVNLANCATSDEVDFASIMIAPSFERDMVMKDGFVDAHEV